MTKTAASDLAKEAKLDPTAIIDIPEPLNPGLSSAKNSTMLSILGMPRDTLDADSCRPVVNEPMRSLIVTKSVGPFRVKGLKPAVASLKKIMTKVKRAHPEVYEQLGTAGMLCARLTRSGRRISNHAWGTAVDLRVGDFLDPISGTGARDGKTLAGLAAIAPLFNAAGWYWGVGFGGYEDGMHFEVADETIRQWQADGSLGDIVAARRTALPSVSIGDEGVEVREVQRALEALGFDILPDGDFGPITHAAIIDFQAMSGLSPDGIVGEETREALGLD